MNDMDRDIPLFEADFEPGYYIHDLEYTGETPIGPFDDEDEAMEHATEVYGIPHEFIAIRYHE